MEENTVTTVETTEKAAKADKAEKKKADKKEKKEKKPSFFKGLKTEFSKIIWPGKDTLAKQTVEVIITTIVLGIVIAVLDLIIQFGLNVVIG